MPYYVPDYIEGGALEVEVLGRSRHEDTCLIRYAKGTRIEGVSDEVAAADVFTDPDEAAAVSGDGA